MRWSHHISVRVSTKPHCVRHIWFLDSIYGNVLIQEMVDHRINENHYLYKYLCWLTWLHHIATSAVRFNRPITFPWYIHLIWVSPWSDTWLYGISLAIWDGVVCLINVTWNQIQKKKTCYEMCHAVQSALWLFRPSAGTAKTKSMRDQGGVSKTFTSSQIWAPIFSILN